MMHTCTSPAQLLERNRGKLSELITAMIRAVILHTLLKKKKSPSTLEPTETALAVDVTVS